MDYEISDGYRMTELGALPEEWEVVKLRDTAKYFIDGDWIELPYIAKEGIRLIQTGNIGVGFFKNREDKGKYISAQTFTDLKCHHVYPGDILICRLAEPIGRCCIIPDFESMYITAVDNTIYRINEDIISKYFIVQYLNETSTLLGIAKEAGGSTRQRISRKNLEKILIPLPPLPEQRRIATILSTLDETVEHTEALIEKYKNIKAGLMSDLLTRGIDEVSRIRSEGTHKFKDSVLGRVPEEWEVTEIKKYLKNIKSGLSRRIENKDIGVPVLISGNIQEGKLDTTDLKYWFLDDPQGANISKYFLNPGDILLCFINSIEQIGKCCIYEDIGRETIYTTNLFRIQINDNTISKFLYYLIDSNIVQEELKCITKPAVNQASFTKPDFESIKVPLLSLFEQRRIAEILTAADQRIEKEEAYRDKLLQLKKGLMQDLLTGKVRVSSDSKRSNKL